MAETFKKTYDAFADYRNGYLAAKDTFGGLPAVERNYKNFLWNNRDLIFERLGEMDNLERENARLNDYAATLEKNMSAAEPAPKGGRK